MANQEQLSILKQGVEVWNKWREKIDDVEIDPSEDNLIESHHVEIDLSGADLHATDLGGANLSHLAIDEANLKYANLQKANFTSSNLWRVDFTDAILAEANLSKSMISEANFSRANLRDANLSKANLRDANLSKANLVGSNFWDAAALDTVFGYSDLSETLGLESIRHYGPSTIGIDTIEKSQGKIPEVFLRGCGLSDWEIEAAKLYNPKLNNEEINRTLYRIYDLRASQAIQISPLFISYSHTDAGFIDKLEEHLNEKGIRFWRDMHHAISGRLEKQIARAIQLNPTVLLVLSEHSIKSDWVEHEVRTARQLEKEMGRDVLCPIALDDSWKNSRWPNRIMEQVMEYNILDFSAWKDDGRFENVFNKLINGLDLFYK